MKLRIRLLLVNISHLLTNLYNLYISLILLFSKSIKNRTRVEGKFRPGSRCLFIEFVYRADSTKKIEIRE
jgi:hypothetical protein